MSEENVFAEIDWDEIPEDPFSVPANTYEAYLTEAVIRQVSAEKGGGHGLSLTFTISDGDYEGYKVQDWKSIPEVDDPKNPTTEERKALSWVKRRLNDLGVPSDKIKQALGNPAELEGTHVALRVTVNESNGRKYTNITSVEVIE
jgi:hypothetical protein